MAHGDDHNLLDEESGVEEIRPRQGTKFVRVCLSAVGCMALAGGGYLAGRPAAISTESLAHMIGELGVPQTVEEAKQFYTQTTKDMTLAEKAAANSNILAAAATVPANQNLALLHTWYNKGAAASDKTIMNQFLYDALISAASPAPKANPASAQMIGEVGVPQTVEEAEQLYTQTTKDMTLAKKAAANSNILAAAAPDNQNLALLHTWYNKGAAASDKTIMNHFLYDALISAGSPVPRANPAPAQSASSYREFGHQYSHETAGKPWPQIVKIDDSVRDIVLPSGASPAVQQLNHWYQHHATAEEKQDFDNRAAEHKNM